MLIVEAQQETKQLAAKFFAHFYALLREKNLEKSVELKKHLQQLGLKSNLKQAQQSDITLNQYYQLLNKTADQLQPSGFFLDLGQCFDISDAGVLGYASLSVENLRQSWELTSRNYALYPHPITAKRIINEQVVTLRIDHSKPSLNPQIHLQEDWLSSTWQWMCQRLPEIKNNKDLCVKLNYPEPLYQSQYKKIFPGKVLFNQPHTELCFPEIWYEIPFPTANPATAELCQQQCALILKQLDQHTDLVEAVRRLLLLTPQRKFPTLEQAAQQFQLPSHSFHRQLKKAGISYRDIVNEVRMELAKDYLQKTNLPLEEISFLLGYDHSANFYRAFKIKVGITATEFRSSPV